MSQQGCFVLAKLLCTFTAKRPGTPDTRKREGHRLEYVYNNINNDNMYDNVDSASTLD